MKPEDRLIITKTPFWNLIKSGLKEAERSKTIVNIVMEKIKELPQDENKSKTN